jgi:hypothetical protein
MSYFVSKAQKYDRSQTHDSCGKVPTNDCDRQGNDVSNASCEIGEQAEIAEETAGE